MGRARLNGQSGGAKINGIVEEYLVQGSDVSAGDFVEFVSTVPVAGTSYSINSLESFKIKATKLTDRLVVITYLDDLNDLYFAQAIEFSGSEPTIGTPVSIAPSTNITEITACMLTESQFVVVYHYYSSAYIMRGIVGEVVGTSISFGSIRALKSGSDSIAAGYVMQNISSTQVLLSFAYKLSTQYYVVLTVSGTAITYGTEYSGGIDCNNAFGNLSFTKLLSGKYLLTMRSGTTADYPYLGVISVSGTVVTLTTYYSVVTTNARCPSVAIISENASESKILLVYSYMSSPQKLYARVAIVSGTVITYGAELALTDAFAYSYSLKAVGNNRFIVMYGTSNYPTAMFLDVDISNNTITKLDPVVIDTDTMPNNSNGDSFDVGGTIFYLRPLSTKYIKMNSISIGGYVKPSTSKYKISGIAKKKGIIGETIPIFTLV